MRQWYTHSYRIHPLASGSKLESTVTEKAEADFLIAQFICFSTVKTHYNTIEGNFQNRKFILIFVL